MREMLLDCCMRIEFENLGACVSFTIDILSADIILLQIYQYWCICSQIRDDIKTNLNVTNTEREFHL